MQNGKIVAVKNASFGLDAGECLALLGVNGAGKTTCFKVLTNEVARSAGHAEVMGFDIESEFAEAAQHIGYCPQYEALFDTMTVEEHLFYYGRIKQVESLPSEVDRLIKALNLTVERTKQARTLSGGNKRKLSVAIALIGSPPVVLLDEPSSGMDPQARRFMWSVIQQYCGQRQGKSAVILTTHSMEEAEALSTRIGIMVKGGQFKCFGSSQQIRNRFSKNYEI